MGVFRFPFNWGSDQPIVVIPPPVVIQPSGTRWSAPLAAAKSWIEGAPVAAQHRFERIYTQPRSVWGQSINFAFRVSSQFPTKIASGTHVLVTSTISTP